ncbi:ABC transporter ATP-binding protein [Amycolatopsis sp. NPDC003676]
MDQYENGKPAPAVLLENVRKVYGKGDSAVTALDGVTASFPHGTFTAVMGPSGSGKSTLLHCAAGLDKPDSGSVRLEGESLEKLNETELTTLRRDRIGFVFQAFNLLPALTVSQNVTAPMLLARRKPNKAKVREVIAAVGLDDRRDHLPDQLSGGQQQRVAIARALVTRPAVIFADEPTGALDIKTSTDVLRLLRDSVRSAGHTIVMVTHDPVAASYADAVLFLGDGRLVGRLLSPTADAVAERMSHLGEMAEQNRRRPAGRA